MRPYRGGQAKYIGIPCADFNAPVLPPGKEFEADFVIFTGFSPQISRFRSRESVAVYGAGPVGLMAAYSAAMRGAGPVYIAHRVFEHLAVAAKINCISINFSKENAEAQIKKLNDGEVDRSVDCVGYQAVSGNGSSKVPNAVLEIMIKLTRAG